MVMLPFGVAAVREVVIVNMPLNKLPISTTQPSQAQKFLGFVWVRPSVHVIFILSKRVHYFSASADITR